MAGVNWKVRATIFKDAWQIGAQAFHLQDLLFYDGAIILKEVLDAFINTMEVHSDFISGKVGDQNVDITADLFGKTFRLPADGGKPKVSRATVKEDTWFAVETSAYYQPSKGYKISFVKELAYRPFLKWMAGLTFGMDSEYVLSVTNFAFLDAHVRGETVNFQEICFAIFLQDMKKIPNRKLWSAQLCQIFKYLGVLSHEDSMKLEGRTHRFEGYHIVMTEDVAETSAVPKDNVPESPVPSPPAERASISKPSVIVEVPDDQVDTSLVDTIMQELESSPYLQEPAAAPAAAAVSTQPPSDQVPSLVTYNRRCKRPVELLSQNMEVIYDVLVNYEKQISQSQQWEEKAKELDLVKLQLSIAHSDKADLQEANNTLSLKLVNLQEHCATITRERTTLQEQVTSLNTQLEEAKPKLELLEHIEKVHNTLKNRIGQLSDDLSHLTDRLLSVKDRKRECKMNMIELQHQLAAVVDSKGGLYVSKAKIQRIYEETMAEFKAEILNPVIAENLVLEEELLLYKKEAHLQDSPSDLPVEPSIISKDIPVAEVAIVESPTCAGPQMHQEYIALQNVHELLSSQHEELNTEHERLTQRYQLLQQKLAELEARPTPKRKRSTKDRQVMIQEVTYIRDQLLQHGAQFYNLEHRWHFDYLFLPGLKGYTTEQFQGSWSKSLFLLIWKDATWGEKGVIAWGILQHFIHLEPYGAVDFLIGNICLFAMEYIRQIELDFLKVSGNQFHTFRRHTGFVMPQVQQFSMCLDRPTFLDAGQEPFYQDLWKIFVPWELNYSRYVRLVGEAMQTRSEHVYHKRWMTYTQDQYADFVGRTLVSIRELYIYGSYPFHDIHYLQVNILRKEMPIDYPYRYEIFAGRLFKHRLGDYTERSVGGFPELSTIIPKTLPLPIQCDDSCIEERRTVGLCFHSRHTAYQAMLAELAE